MSDLPLRDHAGNVLPGFHTVREEDLVCAQDAGTPARAQREYARRAGRVVGLDAGHHPFLSRPGAVADPALSLQDVRTPGEPPAAAAAGPQWFPVSSPLRAPCILALCSLSPTISTVLPRAAYLVVTASSAATDEASQTWAAVRSTTTLSGSPA